jgi:hypothetical protein
MKTSFKKQKYICCAIMYLFVLSLNSAIGQGAIEYNPLQKCTEEWHLSKSSVIMGENLSVRPNLVINTATNKIYLYTSDSLQKFENSSNEASNLQFAIQSVTKINNIDTVTWLSQNQFIDTSALRVLLTETNVPIDVGSLRVVYFLDKKKEVLYYLEYTSLFFLKKSFQLYFDGKKCPKRRKSNIMRRNSAVLKKTKDGWKPKFAVLNFIINARQELNFYPFEIEDKNIFGWTFFYKQQEGLSFSLNYIDLSK